MTTVEKPGSGKTAPSAGRTVLNLLIGVVVLVAGLALIFAIAPTGWVPGLASSTGADVPTAAAPSTPRWPASPRWRRRRRPG